VPVTSNRLVVNAKGFGHTTVFVYDRRGKNVISVTVLPSKNTGIIAEEAEEQIGIPTVTVRAINDTLFLEGSVPTQAASDLAESIADAYNLKVKNLLVVGTGAPKLSEAEEYADLLNQNLSTSGITARAFDDKTIILTGKYAMPVSSQNYNVDVGAIHSEDINQPVVDPLDQLLKSLPPDLKVINLVNFAQQKARQVLVRAKIVDIDRSSEKQLGLNWGTANATTQTTTANGVTDTQVTAQFNPQPILFTQAIGQKNYNNIFAGGGLSRFLPYAVELNALVTEGKARVLSEPSLLVLDGNSANMLVGGELPIPVIQSSSAGNAISVLFKPFGIKLSVAPTIVPDDTIQLRVSPEVSTLDFSSGVQLNGFSIPGIAIRTATSTLQMKDGQTLVIGGLYDNNDNKSVNKVPFLSSIPILGEFFKSTVTKKEEHELLVLIEAEILTPDSLGATPPPADSTENLSIHKPYVPRHEFEQDFPDLQNGPAHHDSEAPKTPISMPGTGGTDSGK